MSEFLLIIAACAVFMLGLTTVIQKQEIEVLKDQLEIASINIKKLEREGQPQ